MEDLLPQIKADDPRLGEFAERLKRPVDDPKVKAQVLAADVNEYAGYATSIFLIGWAVGGLGFGVMGDRIGRVRTLTLTILLYSIFTGLSALSVSVWDFMLYRFLTGLGVGAVFAVAVALVAETMPERPRPFTLGLLQASSALGNCTAALIFWYLGSLQMDGVFNNLTILGYGPVKPWRIMFVIGILPGILAVVVQMRLQEPEKWKQAVRDNNNKAGSFSELLGHPRWRRHALFGLLLAFAGVVGLWGIGFFSIDLQQSVLGKSLEQEAKDLGLAGDDAKNYITGERIKWAGITSLVLNLGAAAGMFAFSWVTSYLGRKPTFAISFILAAASTAMVFQFMQTRTDILWMIPLMGFCQLALFGGYAIYFPELFPTRLRSTGTSFCYNVGRLVAAVGPAMLGLLTSQVFVTHSEPMRPAGTAMCAVFMLGLIALPFLPETKDKPLPEDK
jgi:MFS family permease